MKPVLAFISAANYVFAVSWLAGWEPFVRGPGTAFAVIGATFLGGVAYIIASALEEIERLSANGTRKRSGCDTVTNRRTRRTA
jgi:hypothetical protein